MGAEFDYGNYIVQALIFFAGLTVIALGAALYSRTRKKPAPVPKRISIIEKCDVDGERQLILCKRDDRGFLVMTHENGQTVIESDIDLGANKTKIDNSTNNSTADIQKIFNINNRFVGSNNPNKKPVIVRKVHNDEQESA